MIKNHVQIIQNQKSWFLSLAQDQRFDLSHQFTGEG